MRICFSAFLVGVLMLVLTGCQPGTVDFEKKAGEFYVSLDGDDSWSGQLPEPNDTGTDGPFRSLERAQNAIRELKRAGTLPGDGMTVFIRGGRYPVTSTLRFSAKDAGTKDCPVTWRAQPGEEVVFHGGVVLSGFKPVTDTAVLKRIDQEFRDKIVQTDLATQGITDYGEIDPRSGRRMELYFQHKFMEIARYPNDDWVVIADVPQTGEKMINRGLDRDKSPVPRGRHYGRFTYDGDRPNRWAENDDIWMHGYWTYDWSDQHLLVDKIDKVKRDIYPKEPHHGYGYTKGQRYYFLNILEELDSPGEWYLDRSNGILYFWPPSQIGEDDVSASVMEDVIISLEETSFVTIRDILFECSRSTAVTVRGGSNNLIGGCTMRNLGQTVAAVSGGTNNGITGCDIYDVAAGGIGVNGGDRTTLTPAGNYATNNHIHHYGERVKTYQPALSVHGVGNRLAHNLIHDAPHSGVQFSGNENILEFNEIHHIAKETGDVGAFYTGRNWTIRGNIIRHNYFHHLLGPGLHGVMAVYLDDGASGMTIYGNVFHQSGRSAFIGGGHDNTVENNIFVDCEPSVHIDARGLGWARPYVVKGGSWRMYEKLADVNYKEPPFSTKYPKLAAILDHGDPAVPRGNVVVRNISVGGTWLNMDNRIEVTFEGNLVDEDPGFIDRENENFQLKDDSPAYKLGFKRIPIEKIGLYIDEYRTSLE